MALMVPISDYRFICLFAITAIIPIGSAGRVLGSAALRSLARRFQEVAKSRNSAVNSDVAFDHRPCHLHDAPSILATTHHPVVGGLHTRLVAICCSVYVSRVWRHYEAKPALLLPSPMVLPFGHTGVYSLAPVGVHVRPLRRKLLSASPEVHLHTGCCWAIVTLARSHWQTANQLSNGGNAETSNTMAETLSRRGRRFTKYVRQAALAISPNVALHPKPVEPHPSQRYSAVRTQMTYFVVFPLIH